MELSIHSEISYYPDIGNVAALKCYGNMDKENMHIFESVFLEMRRKGIKRIILDLGETKFLDSTGVGFLINMSHKLMMENGAVRLVNVAQKFQVLFDMLGLVDLLPISPNTEDAIRSFMEKGGEQKTLQPSQGSQQPKMKTSGTQESDRNKIATNRHDAPPARPPSPTRRWEHENYQNTESKGAASFSSQSQQLSGKNDVISDIIFEEFPDAITGAENILPGALLSKPAESREPVVQDEEVVIQGEEPIVIQSEEPLIQAKESMGENEEPVVQSQEPATESRKTGKAENIAALAGKKGEEISSHQPDLWESFVYISSHHKETNTAVIVSSSIFCGIIIGIFILYEFPQTIFSQIFFALLALSCLLFLFAVLSALHSNLFLNKSLYGFKFNIALNKTYMKENLESVLSFYEKGCSCAMLSRYLVMVGLCVILFTLLAKMACYNLIISGISLGIFFVILLTLLYISRPIHNQPKLDE